MLIRLRECTTVVTRVYKRFTSSTGIVKTHHERRLVRYTTQQLFNVVSAVNEYKEFVPWCKESKITKIIDENIFEADMEVGFGMFLEKYTSKVTLYPPAGVTAESLTTNLLQTLRFEWKFTPANDPAFCWAAFKVEYAFKSPLYNKASEMLFREIVENMIKAFESRCQKKYGRGKIS